MICLCKKIFFEGLIKVYCKHYRGTWFHLKNVKILQSVPFSKGKNETKEEVLKPFFFIYFWISWRSFLQCPFL